MSCLKHLHENENPNAIIRRSLARLKSHSRLCMTRQEEVEEVEEGVDWAAKPAKDPGWIVFVSVSMYTHSNMA